MLRSPAGFHVVKLVDQRDRGAPTVVDQTRVRHILVRVNETTSEAEARARIDRVQDRIDAGAKFEDMARINSEDASSAKGGDLGWVNPGDTVPEFEQAMAKLDVGETSPPGAHAVRLAPGEGRGAAQAGHHARTGGATRRGRRCGSARPTSCSAISCDRRATAPTSS